MRVIFACYREYGGLELSSRWFVNRGFVYESVLGGLENVEDWVGCGCAKEGRGRK